MAYARQSFRWSTLYPPIVVDMALLRNTVDRLDRPSAYFMGKNKKRKLGQRDRPAEGEDKRENSPEEPEDPLKDASTLYVGNLSFYTTEEQIHELFSK